MFRRRIPKVSICAHSSPGDHFSGGGPLVPSCRGRGCSPVSGRGGAGLGHGRQPAAWWLIDGLRQPAVILTCAWVPQFKNNPCLCQGGRRMVSANWGWRGKGTGVQPGLLLPILAHTPTLGDSWGLHFVSQWQVLYLNRASVSLRLLNSALHHWDPPPLSLLSSWFSSSI